MVGSGAGAWKWLCRYGLLLKSAREGLAFTPVQADELLGKFEELEKNREGL